MADECDCIECAIRRLIRDYYPDRLTCQDAVKVMSALGAIAGEALSGSAGAETDKFVEFIRGHRDDLRAEAGSPSTRIH